VKTKTRRVLLKVRARPAAGGRVAFSSITLPLRLWNRVSSIARRLGRSTSEEIATRLDESL
jgi:macrodomain Ter protein organizer (MatP/YcbG family)